jgi:endogenous inhibitor of DNA gyrase (YacG/DUF329 family)
MNKKALCPTCDKNSELTRSNSYRPFCSERCRLIDLGQWVNESYSISDTNIDDGNIEENLLQKH